MGVELNNHPFTSPAPITLWEPPCCAAVYAIFARGPSCGPGSSRLIYVGESDSLSERGFWHSHPHHGCWLQQAGGDDNLYIALHLMPVSTPKERHTVQAEIIAACRPCCNTD
ncbi:MAG: hypothetical protein ABFE13_01460 [Phycisphaerales bacterium]